VVDSLLIAVDRSYLNTDMRKFITSQKEESRAQSTDSSKAYRKSSRAFSCSLFACFLLFRLVRIDTKQIKINCSHAKEIKINLMSLHNKQNSLYPMATT